MYYYALLCNAMYYMYYHAPPPATCVCVCFLFLFLVFQKTPSVCSVGRHNLTRVYDRRKGSSLARDKYARHEPHHSGARGGVRAYSATPDLSHYYQY